MRKLLIALSNRLFMVRKMFFLQDVSTGFVGCMRDFKQKSSRLERQEAPSEVGTSLCSGDSEDGTYFGSKGGYIKLCKF